MTTRTEKGEVSEGKVERREYGLGTKGRGELLLR